ncbi:MAG TPA: acyltransferase [Acidimicrobiales bacterium]|nr:acyltransferase [Acidimicrobiales bacterium]
MTATPVLRPEVPAPGRARLYQHRPGLDGIRGGAMLAMLAYHSGFGWAKGTFLSVPAFFTLSGFLIATLLLREREDGGRVDLRAFWSRRARRLLPAGLLGLLLALAYVAIWADPGQVPAIRRDIFASLAYVANWHFISSERSYAELFSDPSPVQHYWTLAIEEQFYVVFPLLVVACGLVRRSRAALVGVLLALCGASMAVSLVVDGPGRADRLYYGTDARALELLGGAVLAVALQRTSARQRAPVASRGVTLVGSLALAGVVGSWLLADPTMDGLHPWVLLGHTVAVALVINAAVRVGPVSDALSRWPLPVVGRLSYGLYVYHWPVFLVLSPARTGLAAVPLLACRLAVTVALAVASYRWIERPFLTRSGWTVRVPAPLVAVGALGAVLVLALAMPADERRTIDFAAATEQLEVVPPADAPEEEVTPAEDPLVVAAFGDSTALMSAFGIDAWGRRTGEVRIVGGTTPFGCTLTKDPAYQPGGDGRGEDPCDWPVTWPPAIRATDAEVALVQFGTWDIVERPIPGHEGRFEIGEPTFDKYLLERIDGANELLLRDFRSVVWLTLAPPAPSTDPPPDTDVRVDRFNELVRAGAARASGRVQVVDLGAWIEAGRLDDRDLRPDGVHFSNWTAIEAGRWLVPAILHARSNPEQLVTGPRDVAAALDR